jgi:hypothetical protein
MTNPTPNPIGLQLSILATRFPSGATEAVLLADLHELERLRLGDPLPEAVLRILHSRETRTYPPLAEIIRRCREVAAEELRAGREAKQLERGGAARPFTRLDCEEIRILRHLAARNIYWCNRAGDRGGGGFIQGLCEHGVACCDSTLDAARAELNLCKAHGIEPVKREPRRVRGTDFVSLSDAIDNVTAVMGDVK